MSQQNKSKLDDNWFIETTASTESAFGIHATKKLHEEKTPFQQLCIYDSEHYGKFMTLDDCMMVTQKDNFIYHEMMSHMALFTHPNPQRVVIIGGGDCGTLKEVLKHKHVKEAWQIEIDERVTRVAEKYFPELCTANDDPRARFHFDDGIKWIEEAKPGSIDIIIVDSTDPIGPAIGLFQAKFYSACRKALGDNGILVHQSDSPLFHNATVQKPMRTEMTKGGFHNIHTFFFPLPTYPSGWWSGTMASVKTNVTAFRKKDAQAKDFKTQYYNAEIHQGSLATPEFLKDIY